MLKTVSSITNAIGALNYKGTWDASSNAPSLASGVGVKGDYYQVSVAGSTSLDGISNWGVGDVAAFNGATWQRIEGGSDLEGVNLSVSGSSIFGLGPASSTSLQTARFNGATISALLTAISYGGSPVISLASAGGTYAAPSATTIAPMTLIGRTTSDGTNFFNTSAVQFGIEATPTSGSHPTAVTIATTPSGSTTRVERFRVTSFGSVGIGVIPTNPSTALDVQSTVGGIRFPNMTTAQKTAITPPAGTVVFDTTLAKLCVYNGSAWQTITSV